ncbi:MAG: hypothetical protein M1823_004873 [Watsoniomyces obsoletus]|nr:MAG: hypothetical protein M1823_004873 [Watsoniomyces obsoletus]
MASFLDFFRSQMFVKLAPPSSDFTGQTIIVTGSNAGLGLEAARHFSRLNASKIILAVRSLERGEAARKSILESTQRSPESIEVWELDLSSFASVKKFAERVIKDLSRLDILLENAGISTLDFKLVEENESTVTVNVISTFLLALLLLPKLRETAKSFKVTPRLVVVSSEVHHWTAFPERNSERIFEELRVEEKARMMDRYNVSKLLEVLIVRELAEHTSKSDKSDKVIINTVNPGFCHSELLRDVKGGQKAFMAVMKGALARTTEEGSRTLVYAAAAGEDTHGKYMGDCSVKPPSKFVLSPEGAETQKRVWKELGEILEKIQPGILQNI